MNRALGLAVLLLPSSAVQPLPTSLGRAPDAAPSLPTALTGSLLTIA